MAKGINFGRPFLKNKGRQSTMEENKIEVLGLQIRLQKSNEGDFVSLTDLAKQRDSENASHLIIKWLQLSTTLQFLEAWEELHNPDFKVANFGNFRLKYSENRYVATPQRFIEETGAIGIASRSGRYGGTFAHKDIALEFCSWLSPRFKVYLLKKFQELIEADFGRRDLAWHISKITDNVDEIRNLLDTIPCQQPERNRLNILEKG